MSGKEVSIKGSWYTDFADGRGICDSISNYVEIFVNDTALYYHDKDMGQTRLQPYKIEADSILKCFGTGAKQIPSNV